MRDFDRYQLLTLAYYAGGVAALVAGSAAYALGHDTAVLPIIAAGVAWVIGVPAAAWLLEPALARWCEAEEAEEVVLLYGD